MKNNLSKPEIKLIANKFRWSAKEAKNATKEFLETSSFANSEEILRICIEADNPEDRKNNIFESLYNAHYDDLVEHVCNQIVNPDPCFDIVVAFNTTELKNSKQTFKIGANEAQRQPSFIYRYDYETPQIFKMGANEALKEASLIFRYKYEALNLAGRTDLYVDCGYDPIYLVCSLCYEYLDKLLRIKFKAGMKRESLLVEITLKVGFLAFEIPCLQKTAALSSAIPIFNTMANRFARAIGNPLDKREITQMGYWLIYVVIERIKEEYGLRGAFRKLAEVTGKKVNSIQPRYFDRKKIVKNEGLTLEDIIDKYLLQKSILEIERKLQEMSVNLSVNEK